MVDAMIGVYLATAAGLLIAAIVVLGLVALAKYLFGSVRHSRPRGR